MTPSFQGTPRGTDGQEEIFSADGLTAVPAARRGRWLVGLDAFWAAGTVALALVSLGAESLHGLPAWRWIFLGRGLIKAQPQPD